MTTTGKTGIRKYRDRKDLSSSESESSLQHILSKNKIMSDKSLSPVHKRRNRSRSGERDHYRSRKRSYSPRDRSSSPIRKPAHRSNDRYQTQHFDGGRRPYSRFPQHRPFYDRGPGRGMRRPFRGGFANRNFRFGQRYHDHGQQGGHYYKDRGYQPQGDRNRRRSFSRSISRSRSRSRSRTPPRRRSLTPETKRRPLSRSLSPLVSLSGSTGIGKNPYKDKDLKGSYDEKSSKRGKSGDRPHKAPHSSSNSGHTKSPDRHGSSSRTLAGESKLSFSREDLEKITIDIHRKVKEPSPTIRRIVNPEEVKLVRRVNEGARPLFEREEIQNPTEDLREEITERRIISVKDESLPARKAGQSSGIDVRDYAQTDGSSRIPLSQRWQHGESSTTATAYSSVPKVHSSIIRRSYSEERDPSPVYDRTRTISPVGGGEYSRVSSLRDRESYRETSIDRTFERHYPDDPTDLRHSLSSRRKDDSFEEGRRKYLDRSDWREGSPQRHFKGDLERGYRSRSRSRSPLSIDLQLRGRSEERLPDFSQRPDRFKYNAWTDKPEVIPKGPSYYEHDDRDRGGTRPFRTRGFRTNRYFRPRNYRGSFQSRGGFVPRSVGGQTSIRRPSRPFRTTTGYVPRTRGYSTRGKDSPSHWEHDMFNKLDKNDV